MMFVICGIAFSYLFMELKEKIKINTIVASILEVLTLGIFFATIYLNLHYMADSYLMCPISVLISFLIFFVFGFDQGIISKFFALKPMQYLGSISMEFYLIHYILTFVIKWGDFVYDLFAPGGVGFACFMYIFLWILLAILLATAYRVIEDGAKKLFVKKEQPAN